MDNVTLTLKNMNHPLDKIFASLPAGREEFLPGPGASPRFSEALHFPLFFMKGVIAPTLSRGSLLATLKGNGSKEPLLLLSHIEVVPVEKESWEYPPFEGIIKDGYIYGRGALGWKSLEIIERMALLVLKREEVSLKRDLIFFATADEKTISGHG